MSYRASARALLVFMTLASGAWAKSASQYIRDAERLYQSGRYVEAAEALKRANQLDPHPRLVYNIARAYDQAGNLRAALEHYQQYVSRAEGADPMLIKRSALAIDRLRALLAKEDASRREQELQRQRLEAEADAMRRRAAAEAKTARRAQDEVARQEVLLWEQRAAARKRNRILSFVAAGVGAAGLGTGVVMGVNALSTAGSVRNSQARTAQVSGAALEAQVETARRQALVADVGFGLAVAGAAAAFFLYPRGEDDPPPELGARLLVGPGGVGVRVDF